MIHEARTEVYLTKAAVIGEGEDIIAKFRLWLEADGCARAITAAKPHLRLYVTDMRGGRETRWTYEGGIEINEQIMMDAGGPFPIIGQVRTLPGMIVTVGNDMATVSKADHNFWVELADGRRFCVWTYPDDSAARVVGYRVTATGRASVKLWEAGKTKTPLVERVLAAVEARKAI